jgi:hypothetical protein
MKNTVLKSSTENASDLWFIYLSFTLFCLNIYKSNLALITNDLLIRHIKIQKYPC